MRPAPIRLVVPEQAPGTLSGGWRFVEELAARLVADGAGSRLVLPTLDPELLHEAVQGTERLVFDSLYFFDPGLVNPQVQKILGSSAFFAHWRPSHEAGLDELEGRRRRAHEDRAFEAAALVLCPSSRLTAELRADYPQTELRSIEAGLHPAFLAASSPRARDTAPLELASVGNLVPQKQALMLARALSAADLKGDVRLTIYGRTDLDPQYRTQVEAACSGWSLQCAGTLEPEELAERLFQADLCIQPSCFESAGLASAEIAASGCPLLLFDVGAARDYVTRCNEPACQSSGKAPENTQVSLLPCASKHANAAAENEQTLRLALQQVLADREALRRRRRPPHRKSFPTWDDCYAQFLRAIDELPRARAHHPRRSPAP